MKKILLFAAALVFALNMTAGNKAQQIGKNRQSIVALSSVAQNARVDKSAVKTTDLTIAKRTAGQKKTFVSVEQRLKDHKVMPVRRAAARVAEGTLVTNLVALPAGTDNFSFAWNAEGENIAGWLVSLLDANGKLIASASYAADDRWMFEEEGSWSYSATYLLQDAKSEEYNGVVGEAWDDNVETTTFEFWGMEFDQDILKEGAYSVKVQPLDADGNIIDEGATASVEVKAYDLSDLTLEAIENNTKLSINFNKPAELPEGAVIYVQVTSGAEVIMIENFESVELPLVVDIEDNKFYSVFAGIYSADDDELGEQVSGDITVGVNPIEPKNLKAEVKEHEVTLSWEVAGEAEAFYLFVYDANDEQIIAEQVAGTSVVKTLANGNYTWEVVAVSSDEQGAYAASEFIEGEAFVVDSKEAMVYDITFTNAQVADYGDVDGKRNFWLTMFNDNDDEPSVGFDLFAPVADKLSGDYTISDNSIGTEYSAWFKNDNDTEGTPFVEASVKIEFLGAEQTEDGVQGNFKITFEAKDADGNIYKGSFEGLALAYDHEEYANSYNVVFVEFTGEEGWPEKTEPQPGDVTTECDNAGIYSNYFSQYGVMIIQMYNAEQNIGVVAYINTDEAAIADGTYSGEDIMFTTVYTDWSNDNDEGIDATSTEIIVTTDAEGNRSIIINASTSEGNFKFTGIIANAEKLYGEPEEQTAFNINLTTMNVEDSYLASDQVIDIELVSDDNSKFIELELVTDMTSVDANQPLPVGEYSFAENADYGQFWAGEIYNGKPYPAFLAVVENGNVTYYYIVSGSVVASLENGVYTITIDVTTQNGSTIKAVYSSEAATGIEDVKAGEIDFNKEMYNVLGQKVGTDYRGIIVQKGHKYIVR